MTTERAAAGCRVSVVGEVDCSTAPRLTESIDAVLATGPAELVVDLAGVSFLDSAGLHALVTAHGRAEQQGIRMRVLVGTRAVLRPIQVTGLEAVLGVEYVEPGAGSPA
ncbi:STAS domain-containing protein [Trujillonella endophytica]|uniref:STAS domain-containing protein n=1 Tax=Trujillonella endophytica TaxID=673521 RepID=UPI001FCD4F89|nr:STAS domain-containing protein [Trujillella endophytica]